eukprot:COSAG06_NODE_56851_length_283_cov_0.271739_2_plen_21_part_01
MYGQTQPASRANTPFTINNTT